MICFRHVDGCWEIIYQSLRGLGRRGVWGLRVGRASLSHSRSHQGYLLSVGEILTSSICGSVYLSFLKTNKHSAGRECPTQNPFRLILPITCFLFSSIG